MAMEYLIVGELWTMAGMFLVDQHKQAVRNCPMPMAMLGCAIFIAGWLPIMLVVFGKVAMNMENKR